MNNLNKSDMTVKQEILYSQLKIAGFSPREIMDYFCLEYGINLVAAYLIYNKITLDKQA